MYALKHYAHKIAACIFSGIKASHKAFSHRLPPFPRRPDLGFSHFANNDIPLKRAHLDYGKEKGR